MDRADVIELLAYCAATDYRRESEAQEMAWSRQLRDVTLEEALWAVDRHYAHETERIMPAHVRRLVLAARNDAHERRQLPPAPGVPPTAVYLAARDALRQRRRGRSATGDGEPSALGDLLDQAVGT